MGLAEARVTERFERFRDTSAKAKVAKDLPVHAVNVCAREPAV
jgi:hypothetical protein